MIAYSHKPFLKAASKDHKQYCVLPFYFFTIQIITEMSKKQTDLYFTLSFLTPFECPSNNTNCSCTFGYDDFEPPLLNLYYKLAQLIIYPNRIDILHFQATMALVAYQHLCSTLRQGPTIIFSIIMKYTLPALLLLVILNLTCSQLDPKRLRVVDSDEKRKNFLVRGNLPISKDRKFQMEELKQQLGELTGLGEFQLVVISFLNFLTAKQTKNRYIEQKYFEQHPLEGQYSTKMILGSLLDPFNYPPLVASAIHIASFFVDLDDIDDFVTDLHEQIHERGRRTVIFVHCSRGMDRTGLVAGAYKMKYFNYEMKQVLEQNSHFGGQRKFMLAHALNGLKWYCLALKGSRQACKTE